MKLQNDLNNALLELTQNVLALSEISDEGYIHFSFSKFETMKPKIDFTIGVQSFSLITEEKNIDFLIALINGKIEEKKEKDFDEDELLQKMREMEAVPSQLLKAIAGLEGEKI